MELYWIYTFSIFLCLSLFHNLSHCQQAYLNNTQLDCNNNSFKTKGYFCNGPQKSCKSFATFRSHPPYDSPVSIAYLLGSEASRIAKINNISDIDKIPPDKQVIVPLSCSCSEDFYQHNTPYTIKYASETYFRIANDTYQGLTTCQALMSQNIYDNLNLSVGLELIVPMRCACPSENQITNGVTFLLTYMVTWGDSFSSISNLAASIDEVFGVTEQSILEANQMTPDGTIYPFTPILVPLKSESCSEKPDNFFCYCPNGYREDETGEICIPDDKGFPVKLVTLLGVGIGMGLLCLLLLAYQLHSYLKKRKYRIRREELFKQNGGFLLLQQLSSYGTGREGKIFTAEEIERATDNYNQSRFLGQGGFGMVYKGMLPDGRIIANKKAKAIDKNRIGQFINEVVILSQINHRNVVKLIGCCLETEVPIIVYEFIPNGTLSYHIHGKHNESSLSWDNRLRIASEVAGALAYMHSAASIPVYHRDIKSSNILLDDKFSAKVADFGTSRSVPFDKSHLTTTIQGTFGYLDPEYFQTSQFTDKSDVYSFGVVLVELLTGEKPISFARDEDERNLVAHFISLVKENRLFQILDRQVAGEAGKEEILAFARLAERCLKFNGKKRPTMKEVATELEGVMKNQRCLQIYKEPLLEASIEHDAESRQESLENSIAFSLDMESSSIC